MTAGDAQRIVAAYLKVVEAHAAAEVYPGSIRDLPQSKETIRVAFEVATKALVRSGALTPELREYLEIAYVSLADYIDEESATLLREYARAGAALAEDPRPAREKASTEAWRRISEQSRLAGQVASGIDADAKDLRSEFRAWYEEAEAERAHPA